MRLTDIGHQLKAFRLESGLKADEIATRLGISRAALYRYEKGEVIKLDTVQRLAELLNVSPLSLLGIGVEYYARAAAYFERARQLEDNADSMIVVGGGFSFLGSDGGFRTLVGARLKRDAQREGADPSVRASAEASIETLEARRAAFNRRRPNLVVMVSIDDVERFAALPTLVDTDDDAWRHALGAGVHAELDRLAQILDTPPLGITIALLRPVDRGMSFRLVRQNDRTMLATNPFRSTGPLFQHAVATVTGAPEGVLPHQRIAETLWRHAIKGHEAAQLVGTVRDRAAASRDRRTDMRS